MLTNLTTWRIWLLQQEFPQQQWSLPVVWCYPYHLLLVPDLPDTFTKHINLLIATNWRTRQSNDSLKIYGFWDVMLSWVMNSYWYFEGRLCLYLKGQGVQEWQHYRRQLLIICHRLISQRTYLVHIFSNIAVRSLNVIMMSKFLWPTNAQFINHMKC
jgi:hypothetical protein